MSAGTPDGRTVRDGVVLSHRRAQNKGQVHLA
jgi:hypothetical protein